MQTILLAEDSSFDVELTLEALSEFKKQYRFVTASNGMEAYESALEKMPVLILMDWSMPILSGINSIKKIKSHEKIKHIPIIVITGKDAEKNLEEALEAGATDYIEKPINKAALTTRVKIALNLSDYQNKQSQYLEEIKLQNEKLSSLNLHLELSNTALEVSENKYKSIYDKTPVMLHSVDAEGNIINVSEFWLEKLGYTKEEVIGKKSTEFLSDESRGFLEKEIFPQFYENGEIKDVSITFKTKNGEVLDALLSAFSEKDERGEIVQSLAVTIDVTDRIKAENQLKSFKDALQHLNFINSDIRLTFKEQLSKSLAFISNYLGLELGVISKVEGESYIINSFYSAIDEFDIPIGYIMDLHDTYCSITYQGDDVLAIPHMGKSEYASRQCYDKFKLECYIGIPLWVNGEKYGTIGLSSPEPREKGFNNYDIEFMKIVGRWVSFTIEKENYTERLLSINASKDRILSTVAHDFRSPLNSVQGLVRVFEKQQDALSDSDQELFKMINKTCDKGLKLISELLEISELEDENFVLETVLTEINGFIKQTVAPFEEITEDKNIKFHYSFEENNIYAEINTSKFSRIIENLVNNAKKFTPGWGEVNVAVKKDDSNVVVSIADNGIGIPEDLQPLIFNKFSKARREGLKGEESTGLGMSIVKNIVDLHNGKIWFESQVNKGTTFYISIPIVQKEKS